jgi:hypothetical protein
MRCKLIELSHLALERPRQVRSYPMSRRWLTAPFGLDHSGPSRWKRRSGRPFGCHQKSLFYQRAIDTVLGENRVKRAVALEFCQGDVDLGEERVTFARGYASLSNKFRLVRHRHLNVWLIRTVLLAIKSINETSLEAGLDLGFLHSLADLGTRGDDPDFLEDAAPLCGIGEGRPLQGNNHLAL